MPMLANVISVSCISLLFFFLFFLYLFSSYS